ncbi:hypothetical protein HK096_002523, partial [Nowakowskiella sp. JEL0078]
MTEKSQSSSSGGWGFSRLFDWGFSSTTTLPRSISPSPSSPLLQSSDSYEGDPHYNLNSPSQSDMVSDRRLSIVSSYPAYRGRNAKDADNNSISSTRTTSSRISSFLPSRRKKKNKEVRNRSKDGLVEQWKSAINSTFGLKEVEDHHSPIPHPVHRVPALQNHLSSTFRSYGPGMSGRTTPDFHRSISEFDNSYDRASTPNSTIYISSATEDENSSLPRRRTQHSNHERLLPWLSKDPMEDNVSITSGSTYYLDAGQISITSSFGSHLHEPTDNRSVSPTTIISPSPTFTQFQHRVLSDTNNTNRQSIYSNGSSINSSEGNFSPGETISPAASSVSTQAESSKNILIPNNRTTSNSSASSRHRGTLSVHNISVQHNPSAVGGIMAQQSKWYILESEEYSLQTAAEISTLTAEMKIRKITESELDELDKRLGLIRGASNVRGKLEKIDGIYKFVIETEGLLQEEIKRQEVIHEILLTEREYIRDMGIIIN